jgi:hypothetical protein
MQRLEVSGAVRPPKWPLGVKWLSTVFPACADLHESPNYSRAVCTVQVSCAQFSPELENRTEVPLCP